jgi:hypothetical protein
MTSSASRSGSIARAEALLLAAALAASLAGLDCSEPTNAQPYAGTCEPLRVLEWTPRAAETNVPLNEAIRLRLDQYPDPDTVDLGAVIVTTGPFYHPGTIRTDLIEKTITYAPAGGWRANLGYDINVRAGLVSLQGCVAEPAHQSFRTSLVAPPATPAPTATPYSAVQPIFAARCAGGGCHRATAAEGGGCLAAPAAGLSLCDADAVDALVDVPSRQVNALHLVEPRDSSRSYLLRKLLPGDTPDVPAPTTLGHRDPPGDPLTTDELHVVAQWIDDGPLR